MARMREHLFGRPIVPKEHGAWAVLYGAFLAGVGVAGRLTLPVLLLLGGVTLLAFANSALVLLLHRLSAKERRRAVLWFAVYAVGALACLAPLVLLYHMTFLLAFGMAAACFFVLRAFCIQEGKDRSLPGELIGMAGLTVVGPAAHAVAAEGARPMGALLWLLLLLFFASGVLYVRMRIRVMAAHRKRAAAVSDSARWSCLVYHALLLVLVPILAATHLIPWAVLLAFTPALWRAASGLRRKDAGVNLRRLGWSEVCLTATFVLILVVAL